MREYQKVEKSGTLVVVCTEKLVFDRKMYEIATKKSAIFDLCALRRLTNSGGAADCRAQRMGNEDVRHYSSSILRALARLSCIRLKDAVTEAISSLPLTVSGVTDLSPLLTLSAVSETSLSGRITSR